MSGKPKAIIFDLDGTLCDVEHRRHYVTGEKKYWDAFHGALVDDKPHGWCVWMARAAEKDGGVRVIFVTGREEKYRPQTIHWIRTHVKFEPNQYKLFMRPDKDYRPDEIIKKELYDKCVAPMFDVMMVVDDRKKVTDMWRSIGLTCLQCAEGNF